MTKSAKTKSPCQCSLYVAMDIPEGGEDAEVLDSTQCPGTLTGRTFAPGHDAKLKGFLIRAGLASQDVTSRDGLTKSAMDWAHSFGFGHMVRDGIENGKIDRAEKSDKARTRKAKAERRNDEANEKTHDGNKARKARELAALVEAEEAKFAAEQPVTEIPDPEWDEDDAPRIANAKVGRWIYEGTIEGDTFTYVKANGEAASTTKFELV